MSVAINEAGHYQPAPAVDDLGPPATRLGFKFASRGDAEDLRSQGQHRAVPDDAEFTQSRPATWDRRPGQGQELRGVAEE
jgi:hypothetical protein